MFSTRVKWKMWSNYSLLPFRQVSQHSPERQCAAKKKKVSFFFFFRPVKTLSLDFLIHLICINIAGWHQQFNHLINLDLSIYVDQHKLRHLENGLQAVGSMRWTGSKCMFRTAAAHVESEACSYSTLHESKAKDCFIFSALIRILLSYIFILSDEISSSLQYRRLSRVSLSIWNCQNL